jgi:hypothetical protein
MKPSKLYEALHALIGERVPSHIWGACAVNQATTVARRAGKVPADYSWMRPNRRHVWAGVYPSQRQSKIDCAVGKRRENSSFA